MPAWFTRAIAAAVVALAGLGAAQAQDALPERRITVEAGVDFYGGDLRSIYGTTPADLPRRLPRGGASAPPSPSTPGRERLFSQVRRRGAHRLSRRRVSATLAPAARRARRARRRRGRPSSAFCPTAASPPRARPALVGRAAAGQPDRGGRGRRRALSRGAVNRSDAAAAWAALAAFAAQAAVEDWGQREALRDLGGRRRGSTPSCAPAATPRPAEAARLTAVALEARGRGPRRARRAAPRRAARARRRRSRRRWRGPRASTASASLDRQVDFEAARAARLRDLLRSRSRRRRRRLRRLRARRRRGASRSRPRDRQLCIDGLAHGAATHVTLRAGLPSAAGETPAGLGRRRRSTCATARPAVRFAGRAYVLPKSADAALPIGSVNADEVALRLYRVGDAQRRLGPRQRRLRQSADRRFEEATPRRRARRAGLGGDGRARAGAQPRRRDGAADGRGGRRPRAGPLRADRRGSPARRHEQDWEAVADAVVRGDRPRPRHPDRARTGSTSSSARSSRTQPRATASR